MPRLVTPRSSLRTSFLGALAEFQDEGDHAELDAGALAAPEEFEDASKGGWQFWKKKSKVSPSEMGGGTDDIANPDVSPASQ